MNQQKQTKIVATISDLNCSTAHITALAKAGMNVVRLNTAHQTHADTLKIINNVRSVSDTIPLLLDTKGPEVRTTKGEEKIYLKKGTLVQIRGDPNKVSTAEKLYVSYDNIVSDVNKDTIILIDDGDIALQVKDKDEDKLFCEVLNDGVIDGRKSVNIPGAKIRLPSLTEKDKDYVQFAIENDIDFIAHSFVRNKEDLIAIQNLLDKKKSAIKLIAKIENQEGVDNIDEILEHCHGIMVARGDLGIEIPAEKIPLIQKNLIKKCMQKNKVVITATQMLHTMIKNPRPTRAEVSDIANAVLDGTDALMLSGETAYGAFGIEAVQTMTRVALEAEKQTSGFNELAMPTTFCIPSYLAKSAVRASLHLPSRAIVVDTNSGMTARTVASYRPKTNIIAMCYHKHVARELGLSFGVYAQHIQKPSDVDDFTVSAVRKLVDNKCIQATERVIFLAGSFGKKQHASFVEIITPQDVL